jgi:predicted glutamine amidotransferase
MSRRYRARMPASMCRMFGLRAAVPHPVRRSLLREPNALCVQSKDHPDGWGIGHYAQPDRPLVDRGISAAFADQEFAHAAERVVARTVVAHVRRASCGPVTLANTHPFVRGRWLFAHNGTVTRFSEDPLCRQQLEAELEPDLRATLVGDTDSERCFLLFLGRLRSRSPLAAPAPPADIVWALHETVRVVRGIADRPELEPSSLTFIVSDGESMLALRHGRSLHHCVEAGDGLPVARYTVASEVLGVGVKWEEIPEGGMVGVGGDLRLI